ncbi:MAG: flagellar motor stator protein MotA [Nitrospirota bacterium]
MFIIIGFGIVLASVIGGYLMEKGNLYVLLQPAELLIIGGAATGALLISSPPRILGLVMRNIVSILSSKSRNKNNYLELLSLLYKLFAKIRKDGLIAIEADIENPSQSPVFSQYRSILSHHSVLNFICDNFKVIISANIPSHELDSLTDLEIETTHREAMIPANSMSRMADGLPGLGIVAAVLGVVLTMGKIDQTPAVLGHSVGAALVGTFLGVLLCYGFVGPLAANLEHKANEDATYFQVIKVGLVSFVGGAAPQMAVEFARRAIPETQKPTFDELEQTVRGQAR